MNRAAVIQQVKETQQMLAKLLDLLEASEHDKFAAYLYQPADSSGTFRSVQAKATRRSSEPFSQPTRSRKAWASMATFALGSTCCAFASERHTPTEQ
jgi:hypothetical protein